MRNAIATALVGACLAAAAPAAATDLGLRLDLGYLREDVWSDAVEDTGTRLDFNLAGEAAGYLLRPGTVDWNLGAELKRLRQRPIGGSTLDDDGLRFRGRVGLLERHASPVSLVVYADRAQDDFTTQDQATSTGTILSTTFGAQAALRGGEAPSLRAGFMQSTTENSGFGRATARDDLRRITAGASHASAMYAVAVDYQLDHREGSYASQNFDDHTLTLNGSLNVGPETVASVTDRYYLRSPTLLAATNPSYEDHGLIALVAWQRERTRSQTRYFFDSTTIEAPTLQTRQQVVNNLTELYEAPLSPELRLTSTLGLTSRDSLLGTLTSRAYGESLASLLTWERRDGAWSWLVQGGGSLGLLQDAANGNEGAWGLQTELGAERAWDAARGSARYSVSYRSNLDGASGWSLSQAVTFDGSARPAPDLQLQANLIFSGDRIHSEFFGDGANRRIQLRSSARWHRYLLELYGGLSSGILGAPSSISGDGLFLPAPFNSHNAFVTLSLTAPLGQAISAYVRTRAMRMIAPDRDPQTELGLQVGLAYSVGALVVSVDDEYVQGGSLLPSGSQNRLFLRLSRAFGTRF